MQVLGIETSCDETGIAIYTDDGLLAHQLYSQAATHAEYGGVVPELASRDHIRKLAPMVRSLLAEQNLNAAQIDGIAYTAGPGLAGALLVGAAFARSLAWAWHKPAIGVHHMEGHLLAPLLEPEAPDFPFVALLVSGGHTQLMQVDDVGCYTLLGESVDDAAGEAFDKTAKLLGLGYPGGPALAALATQGNPDRFHFPRPMTDRPGLDMSFSGLKTAAVTTWRSESEDLSSEAYAQLQADIARAFEDAVVDTLLIKCSRALQQTNGTRLVLSGGVSANQRLRLAVAMHLANQGGQAFYPRPEFCTDNGAMIAHVGWHRLRVGEQTPLHFPVYPRWPMDKLEPLSTHHGK